MWVDQIYGPEGSTGEVCYHVNNQLRARLRDIDRAGEILQRALEAGANSVGGITFGVEDTATLERTARDEAVAGARAKATQLAAVLGVHSAPFARSARRCSWPRSRAEWPWRRPSASAAQPLRCPCLAARSPSPRRCRSRSNLER